MFEYIRNSRSELITVILLLFSFLFVSLVLISQELYIVVIMLSLLFTISIIICKLCVTSNDFIRAEMLRISDHIGLNERSVSFEKLDNNNDNILSNRGLSIDQIQSIPTKI